MPDQIRQRAQNVQISFHLINLSLTLILLFMIFVDVDCSSHPKYVTRWNTHLRRYVDTLGPCWAYKQFYPLILTVVYLVYLGECLVSETRIYLLNNTKALDFETYLRKIKDSAPRVGTRIQCSHPQTSGKSTIDATTFSEDSYFNYSSWEDVTGKIIGIFDQGLVKLQTEKIYEFGNIESEERFKAHREGCIIRNFGKDKFTESISLFEVPEFQDKGFFHRKGTKRPFYLNLTCFWILSACLLSWPYRMWIEFVSDRKKIVFRKVIYVKEL